MGSGLTPNKPRHSCRGVEGLTVRKYPIEGPTPILKPLESDLLMLLEEELLFSELPKLNPPDPKRPRRRAGTWPRR